MNVSPVLIVFRLAEFAMNSVSLLPSKFNAPPDLPVVHVGPFCSVPLLPFPEPSFAVVPVPSSRASFTMGPDVPDDDDVTVRPKVAVRTTEPAVPVTVIVDVASGVDAAV